MVEVARPEDKLLSWVTYPNTEMIDVQVIDKNNKKVFTYPWNVVNNGTYHYKAFYLYCKNLGGLPKGIAIGTHNGEFGEWVPLTQKNLSDIILVEGSETQFNKLKNNFKGKEGLEFVFDVITPEGGDVEFFEGGLGYTNSVVERVIRSWEKEEINSSLKESISIKDLINDPWHKFIKDNYFVLYWLGILIVSLISFKLVVYALILPGLIAMIDSTLVNWINHRYGEKTYDTNDFSTNNYWLNLWAPGGALHNNHHHSPAKYHNEHLWWEFDFFKIICHRFKKNY